MAARTVRGLVPHKLTGWHIAALPPASLNEMKAVPDVTLVQLDNETRPADLKAIMPRLVHIQEQAPRCSYVLFSVKDRTKTRLRRRALKRYYSAVVTQINRDLPAFPNPDRVGLTFVENVDDLATQLAHIRAKLDLETMEIPAVAAPRPSPLDQVKEIISATGDLRAGNGNLSAAAVAPVFGVSISQLAEWLGRSRQALAKTPDAESVQNELGFFERVARLRAVVPGEDFLKWLRMPNAELDNKKPLDLLATGERQVVADLVDDMLTGAPA
jgi:hypothetical protein